MYYLITHNKLYDYSLTQNRFSYTIIYLRDILLYKEIISISAIWCLCINIFVILLTKIVLEVGERRMKKVGSFDLF